jgi:hypothetical protein
MTEDNDLDIGKGFISWIAYANGMTCDTQQGLADWYPTEPVENGLTIQDQEVPHPMCGRSR